MNKQDVRDYLISRGYESDEIDRAQQAYDPINREWPQLDAYDCAVLMTMIDIARGKYHTSASPSSPTL